MMDLSYYLINIHKLSFARKIFLDIHINVKYSLKKWSYFVFMGNITMKLLLMTKIHYKLTKFILSEFSLIRLLYSYQNLFPF